MTRDEVAVTCIVPVPITKAFEVLTEGIDEWWVRSGTATPDTVVRFVGGQLVLAGGSGPTVLGTVTVWDPPTRLEMEWTGPHSQPGDSVAFELMEEPPGTRLTVRHRRLGLLPGEAAATVVGLWWGDLLYRLARMAGPPKSAKTSL